MTLLATLTALHGNESLNITVEDSANVELITFKAPGYEAIESDYDAREVLSIKVNSGSSVSISIADATTTEPETPGTGD